MSLFAMVSKGRNRRVERYAVLLETHIYIMSFVLTTHVLYGTHTSSTNLGVAASLASFIKIYERLAHVQISDF